MILYAYYRVLLGMCVCVCLEEKGLVISIQHLQSHRRILGNTMPQSYLVVQRYTRPNLAIGEAL